MSISISNESINTNVEQECIKPNFISRLFMCWVNPVIVKGNKGNIQEEDLIKPDIDYSSELLGSHIERYWVHEYECATRANRKPSLCKAICRAFWLRFITGAFNVTVCAGASVVQPMLFAKLLAFWEIGTTMTRQEAGLYALAILALNFVRMLCQHHHTLFASSFAIKMKVACSALLYRKLLRMNHISIGEVAAGRLINILSNDMTRFDYVFPFLHNLLIVPIQLLIILYFLYISAGYAPLIGIFSVVLLLSPIQAGLIKLSSLVRHKVAERSDTRIKLMTEIINSIQVIKMYAWERPFQMMVQAARAREIRALWKSIFIRSIVAGFLLFSERTMMFITIITTLVLTGNLMTATLVYPIHQYYSIIQMNVTMMFPIALAYFSEMLVTLDRIQVILMMDEKEDLNVQLFPRGLSNKMMFNSAELIDNPNHVIATKYTKTDFGLASFSVEMKPTYAFNNSEYAIKLDNVSGSWTKSTQNECRIVRNISLKLEKDKICTIIGPVGSGKSTLLHIILKELPSYEGNVNINGSISYASQDSWLFPATVRENILFGLPYDDQKYREVCRVCSLLPDFKQFPHGDLSFIGERGVLLSGGQKARVNLARCIYREADIYLLDDPLSAVDANVGRELYEKCITGYLNGHTRILVTHQINYLKFADLIIALNGGTVEIMGTYDELVSSGKIFTVMLSNQKAEVPIEEIEKQTPFIHRKISQISNRSFPNFKDEIIQVQEAEQRATGSLKWEVALKYLTSVKSIYIMIFTLLTIVMTQVAATTVDYWLSYWTNQVNHYRQSLFDTKEPNISLDETIGSLSIRQYLIIYGCVVLSLIFICHLRIIYFVSMTMRASQNLHNAVYNIFSQATMRFFDTNPSGRVLNRFSKDMGTVDEFLPRSLLDSFQMFLSIISILTLNAIALPWTLLPTLILLIVLTFLFKYYLKAAQAVKRLEATTKSPIFGMITSTIAGISTIRSSNSENIVLNMFDNAQNINSSAYYTFIGAYSAFGLYLDAICLIYLGTIITVFLLVDISVLIPAGSVGLAMSQSMTLTLILQITTRYTVDFFGHMTAIERLLEYTKLPIEENMHENNSEIHVDWPSNGTIVFDNVFLNYGPEEPPVLKDLNFKIESGWKVGVVGRTGAGKSSLVSAIFQLYDIKGEINIDGIDINVISKKNLRSKISIIPQEPVLFSATVRYNLDPFGQYNDEELWNALEQVELKEFISTLDYKVTSGGTNFSVGQRQLVCLARAILRSNKILIMDEATANVDPQTDAMIQRTIRRQFANCTVITIAHRLNTIMDSDRVLVMDKGIVAEFDNPRTLLSNSNSIFSSMVKRSSYMHCE